MDSMFNAIRCACAIKSVLLHFLIAFHFTNEYKNGEYVNAFVHYSWFDVKLNWKLYTHDRNEKIMIPIKT